ncbi:hypothetical protein DB31_3435 [Hyalangium minutum]|uniref:Uncharacterized protein n=1 Tax=Hyalangium minutum TaxID=394096 RepID=A0A085WUE2_9BACT|nr:hypothetical protein DB31_3435 [Hyalangium minutum]
MTRENPSPGLSSPSLRGAGPGGAASARDVQACAPVPRCPPRERECVMISRACTTAPQCVSSG